jgi:hypothetical protein
MLKNKKVLGVALLLGFVAIGTVVYAAANYPQTGATFSALLPVNGLTNVGWNSVVQDADNTDTRSARDTDCKAKCFAADSEADCERVCPIEKSVCVGDKKEAYSHSSNATTEELSTGLGNSSSWSETQSVQLTRNADDSVFLKVDYTKDGDSVKRTFEGPKEEVLRAIDEDEDLPAKMKERLKYNLSDGASIVDPIAERMKQHRERMNRMFSNSWIGNDWFFNDSFVDDFFNRHNIFHDDSTVIHKK